MQAIIEGEIDKNQKSKKANLRNIRCWGSFL